MKRRIALGLLALLGAYLITESMTYAQEGVVTARRLNIRAGPGTSYTVIQSVGKGTRLPIEKVVGEWVKLRMDREAWVVRKYMKLPKEFEVDKELSKQNAFLDWATGTGDLEELSIDGPGTISVVLVSSLYQSEAGMREFAERLACGYRTRTEFDGRVTVTVWTAPGPGRREVAKGICE